MPYKVVANDIQNNLVSACAWGNYECSYSPDTWTVAPIGGLLCFDNIDAAKMFLCEEMRKDLELWECEGENLVSLGFWNIGDPVKGWAVIPQITDHWWPAGTVAYKRVKLLKRIPFELLAC